jgi:hypothetical protein
MENVTTITVALLLASISLKLTDLTKYVVLLLKGGGQKEAANGILTMAVSAAAGILAAFVLRGSDWGDEIAIGKQTLDQLSASSTVIFGIVFSTAAGTLYDFKKAFDQQDSASKPKLVNY